MMANEQTTPAKANPQQVSTKPGETSTNAQNDTGTNEPRRDESTKQNDPPITKDGTADEKTSLNTPSGDGAGSGPSSAPNPDIAGTSRQAHNNAQENNQILNPDLENHHGHAAAPGVVPTNKVNQDPAPTDMTAGIAGQELEPTTAKPNDKPKGEFTLTRGKHQYRNKAGKLVTARPGDSVPLSKAQYEALRDRFTPNS
jgi:hypothetical protein